MDPMDADDSEATRSDAEEDAETEDEECMMQQQPRRAAAPAAPHLQQRQEQQTTSRSRATSPSASVPSDSAAGAGGDDVRLTARQRARMEKEAGLAEDVAWSEMELLPKLAYSWKGKGPKETAQLTEAEWLKRQEALERRRMRSLRDKREAEEAVKAKIRRAVTARFRTKMGPGGDSGLDGQGGAGGDQEGGYVRPGWVKMRYRADGVTVAWNPAAHPLSLPVPVVAVPDAPTEPVDLPLQPARPGEPWQVPPSSSGSFKVGCVLSLQPAAGEATMQQQQQQQDAAQLRCLDSQGWAVGCLAQQQVLEALEFARHWPPPQQQQQQQQKQAPDWQHWRAVIRSVRRSPDSHLAAVVVRLLPQQQRQLS